MKYDVTHILTSLKNDVKGTEKDIQKYEKMKIKDTNIFNTLESVFEKKPNGYIRNISVIQLRDRVYNVTFPA